MKKITIFISVLTLSVNVFAQTLPVISNVTPIKVERGDAITFTGKNFPNNKSKITIFLNGKDSVNPFFVSPDSTTIAFTLPKGIQIGIYKIGVRFILTNNVVYPISSESITILGQSGEVKPEITSISPVFIYEEKDSYSFQVMGSGFSLDSNDNNLILGDYGQVPVCWNSDNSCDSLIRGEVISSHQLNFTNVLKKKYRGNVDIKIRVGHLESEKKTVTLSRFSKWTPLIISIISIAILMALLYLINRTRQKKEIIDGRSYSLLMQVLIDKETDTLSISRFQFMVWTLVAIFSYLYLLISRSLIQGNIDFVDIPDGLPAIILISAGTTVCSSSITNIRGSKGAGSVHPSWGNLITNGGVIAPERIQLFLWTVVGAISFIMLVVLRKPESINELPNVPNGFLELMGVSSAGYLGGKLTRKPGPIIDSIEGEILPVDPVLGKRIKLTIYGHNLSDEAGFQLGSEKIETLNIAEKSPEIIERENEKPEDAHLAKTLSLTLINVKDEWLNENVLTLINQDGQKAGWKIKINPAVTPAIQH